MSRAKYISILVLTTLAILLLLPEIQADVMDSPLFVYLPIIR